MKRKSPVLAFFLNFFFPGIGFAYLNISLIFTIFSIIYFVFSVIAGSYSLIMGVSHLRYLYLIDLIESLLFGILGYGLATHRNEKIMSQTELTPSFKKDNQIYCQNCGTKNDEDSKFCANCGNKIIKPPKTENNLANEEIFCKFCGFKNDHDSKFCSKCGKEILSHEMSEVQV